MLFFLTVAVRPDPKLVHRVAIREAHPREVEQDRSSGACCSVGLWIILAVPLGFAAVATLKH